MRRCVRQQGVCDVDRRVCTQEGVCDALHAASIVFVVWVSATVVRPNTPRKCMIHRLCGRQYRKD